MFMQLTDPCPEFPSKTKKLAIGGSVPESAFRISWASKPPTTAQTGENSCKAVVHNELQEDSQIRKLCDTYRAPDSPQDIFGH